jgi:hypothetical protein
MRRFGASLVSGPSNGTLVFDSETGALTNVINTGFFGTDSLMYRAVDGAGSANNLAT